MPSIISLIQNFRKWIRQYPLIHKFIKFGFVGVASTLVSLFVFWVIMLQFPQFNLVSKAIGYILGFFVGFTLNKLWTYVDHTEEGEKYLVKYMIVYAFSFLVYLVFNFVCDHVFHPEYYLSRLLSKTGMDFLSEWVILRGTLVTNVMSIFVTVTLNFIGTNFLVFRVPDPEEIFD
ncbi:MAG: GtrA family protein [Bacteroidia bacterium]